MSVAVYSRLGDLLRARGLGVEDLRRRIVADTGLEVNARTPASLVGDKRVMRPDIEVGGRPRRRWVCLSMTCSTCGSFPTPLRRMVAE